MIRSRNARGRSFFAGFFLALFVLAGFAGTASAKPAGTKVTIDNTLPRLYGYVSSPRAKLCASHRTVRVFKVGAGTDTRVGSGKTRKFGESGKFWQWSLAGNNVPGRFYAKAAGKRGCAQGISRVVEAKPPIKAGAIPMCPGDSGSMCVVAFADRPLGFSSGPLRTCRSFSASDDICSGYGGGGAATFGNNQEAKFSWAQTGVGRNRGVSYVANNGSFFTGFVPDPGSDRFTITDARAVDDPISDRRWCTADLPGIRAGEVGGPINIDFENREIGAAAYFHGTLQRKNPGKPC